VASVIMALIGVSYVFSIAIETFEYNRMQERLGYYKGQFLELKSTISALKTAEHEFKKLFSVKSKSEVLENMDFSDSGSIDIDELKAQIQKTVETVGEIKDYLSQQKDLYMATPKGWPAGGRVTSGFGPREHPVSGEEKFHSGLDVAAPPGTPVRVTADGVASFSGWSGSSGNLVVIEHGFGYSTFYAHNKMNTVRVGQVVKRGDVVAYVGSTGNTTGPHLHYEVWQNGRPVNPMSFIAGR